MIMFVIVTIIQRFFFIGLFVPCHIPNTRGNRAQKEGNERDLGMVLLTSPRMCYVIMVCSVF